MAYSRDLNLKGPAAPTDPNFGPVGQTGPSSERFWRRPTLPGGLPPSTIGAGRLNFRVRNGNGCIPAAITTRNMLRLPRWEEARSWFALGVQSRDVRGTTVPEHFIAMHDSLFSRVCFLEAEYRAQALGRLVPVC